MKNLHRLAFASATVVFAFAVRSWASPRYSVDQNTTTQTAVQSIVGTVKVLDSTTTRQDTTRIDRYEGIVTSRTITVNQAGVRTATITVTGTGTVGTLNVSGNSSGGVGNFSILNSTTINNVGTMNSTAAVVTGMVTSSASHVTGSLVASSGTFDNSVTINRDLTVSGAGQTSIGTMDTATLQATAPSAAGTIVYNSDDEMLYISTGTNATQWKNVMTGVAP